MKINVSIISPDLSCVYELTPGLNNDNPILHIFNTDDEAKAFWENGLLTDTTDGYWFYFPSNIPLLVPEWNENVKLICSEQLWNVNGTIYTTTLLRKKIS